METNPYATPQQSDVLRTNENGELASLGDRFLGALLDGLVIIIPIAALGFGIGILSVSMGIDPLSTTGNIIISVAGGLVGIGVFLAINGYLLANRGQTVGKVVMKTRIVAEDGSMVPFGTLVLKRYLPFWVLQMIPTVGSFVGLVDALPVFRQNRKCLHDEIAGTKVIKIAGN